jgi:hypothetical protein
MLQNGCGNITVRSAFASRIKVAVKLTTAPKPDLKDVTHREAVHFMGSPGG